MVGFSLRQLLLRQTDEVIAVAAKHHMISRLLGLPHRASEDVLLACQSIKRKILNGRHINRGRCRKRKEKFGVHLDPEHPVGLSDRDFKFHFRLTRASFWELVELLKDHPSLNKRPKRGPRPPPPSHQLLGLFKYCGCKGNSSCSIACRFQFLWYCSW